MPENSQGQSLNDNGFSCATPVEFEPSAELLDAIATLQYTSSISRIVLMRNVCQVLFDLVMTILMVVILLVRGVMDKPSVMLAGLLVYLYAVDFSNFFSSVESLLSPSEDPDPDNVARLMVTFTLLARFAVLGLLVCTACN